MHVLTKVNQWLRPDGVLLDLHPEPEHPTIDFHLPDSNIVPLGQLDMTSLISNIRAARAALGSLVEAGWFRSERSLVFDFSSCFSSVDQWLRHREDRRATSVLAPDIVARARQFLAASGGEVCVTERIQATRLARVER